MNDEPARALSFRAALLIAAGVVLALILAFLLSRLDALRTQQVLPSRPIEVIDLEATLSAVDVTIVNITGDVGIELITPGAISGTSTPMATLAGTAVPVFQPTCAAAPPGWSRYTLQEGDSLASLALRFGSTIQELQAANCLGPGQTVSAGQELFVEQGPPTPTVAATGDCAPPAGWTEHIVSAGETLGGLAATRNTTVSLIMRVNCLEQTLVLPGDRVFLPSPLPTPTVSPPAQLPPTRLATPPVATATIGRPLSTAAVATPTVTRSLATATRLATATATIAPEPDSVLTQAPPATASATPRATTPATATVAPAVSPVPSQTSTPPASPTATLTLSPTATPTWTMTPTMTPSPTPTATIAPPPPSATPPPAYPGDPPTATPTNTPTATPTATPTPTVAPYPA